MGVQEVIKLLEEEMYAFWPESIAWIKRDYGLKIDNFDVLAKEVMEEGVRQTMGAVEKLLEALGISLPLSTLEEALRNRGGVHVFFPRPSVGLRELNVEISDPTSDKAKVLRFPYRRPEVLEGLVFHGWAGAVSLFAPYGVNWRKGKAFVKAKSQGHLEKVLETARALEPFLSHTGLDGLSEALESLRGLKREEAQAEGGYTLVRGEDFWALRRGAVFGDLNVDKALLSGDEVSFSFPEDTEIAFRAYWSLQDVVLPYLRFRLGEEAIELENTARTEFSVSTLRSNPVIKAIQRGLKRQLRLFEADGPDRLLGEASPKMLAFLRAFAEHKDPFCALAEGRLRPYVLAEMFLGL